MRELLHKLCEFFLEQNVVTSYNWDVQVWSLLQNLPVFLGILCPSLVLVLLLLDSVLCGQTAYPTAKLNSQLLSDGRVMSL